MAQSIDDARRRQKAVVGARVPPHNIQAEESLLGAMLLSRDAIVASVEVQLSADDFYKPAHGHIYDAITSLYAQGEPADPVTVAESLRRAGVLEGLGGPSILITLQAGTPAIGNAGRYARIIEEHSLLRRLIRVAGDIAEIGYGLPDDVANAVDEAEAMIFDVAQRRVTDSMATIRDLLSLQLDHLEALYERNQEITGVPTGFIDLDRQLAGLQPSNLVIIGGRPGTGKALALDTPIPTPAGWTTMGGLRPGDQVIGADGRPCRVTFATPVMHDRPCFEVVFDDGTTIVADADHQWFAHDSAHRGHPRIVTTQQMLDGGILVSGDERPHWNLPLTEPLDLPDADLPVDPYVLGRWVGEGMSGQPAAGRLHAQFTGRGPTEVLTRERCVVGFLPGSRAHIPAVCLRASAAQRLALLQGIVDAGGHTSDEGVVELCLIDLDLLRQVRELVCGLGHKPGPVGERSLPLPDGSTARTSWLSWSPIDVASSAGSTAETDIDAGSRRAITAIRPMPSVPVRCITVDSPDHLYLAGESMIPTHNTSFALGIAAHAALEARTPVLVFSLEMSHRELTQRLLCSEARVDATRMRNGKLLESDWPKISHAVGRLGESPIYIDDNPHLTIMEIRAKARRLKSREGLGLIIIDYMQLMSGRSNAENRQVEVSEMSRGLKILARELEVPVIALSQLSRNLESRADKRPVLADLRESGCLTADTRVARADTGVEVTMGELFLTGERDISVWSIDHDLRLVPATMTHVFASGVKPVFELRLASGRRVKASANHPFMTVDGWRRLDQLGMGSRVAALHDAGGVESRPGSLGTQRPGDARTVALLDRMTEPSTGVLWDRVVAVDAMGEEPVYDATVKHTHNFVANGIHVHNSLEQDADVVIFLYRDEVYNRDTPDRGTAEVIVAKHRNGPIGVTHLAFLDHYTRFANMARV